MSFDKAISNDYELSMIAISPWVNYLCCMEALFKEDPDVTVKYVEPREGKDPIVKLYVNGVDKCKAFTDILPTEKKFECVTLKIEVIPSNALGREKIKSFEKAFEGNEAVKKIMNVPMFGGEFSYIVFKKEVVQYKNDNNIGDYNAVRSTLYQDIANEVFDDNHAGIFFCTDVE